MICETVDISEQCLQDAVADEIERRRLHRKPFLREARFTQCSGHSVDEPVFCRDISRDGIGLLHENPLEVGTRFTLAIPMLGRQLEIQCQVNWCERVGERHYFSGNDYQFQTTPQSLVLLSAVMSQELNRRLHRRYPFVRPVTVEDETGQSQSAFTRDISKLGIGLIHQNPITPGSVSVTIHRSEADDVVAVAEIRRCTAIGHGWYSSGGRFPADEPERCTLVGEA